MRGMLALALVCVVSACAPSGGKLAAKPPSPAQPPEFCTRTLGVAECFAHPELLPDHPAGVADGPWQLTPEQVADSKKWWRF